MRQEAFIHVFCTPTGHYLYDVNSDDILKIPYDVFSFLRAQDDVKPTEGVCQYLDMLKAKGFLKSKRVEKSEHGMTEIMPYALNNKLSQLVLQITQSCNLRCNYCAYSGEYKNRVHSQKQMSFETAQKSIDFLIRHSKDSKSLSIGFYGGEPFLRFDFIKKCVDYADSKAEGRVIRYNTTTNGTLLDLSTISYCVDHDFLITFSLDGPDYIHNKNRCFAGSRKGSYETLIETVTTIKRMYPDYYKTNVSFNMVLDPTNSYSCIEEFVISNELFDSIMYSAHTIEPSYRAEPIPYIEDFYIEREYELFKIFLKKTGRLPSMSTSKLLESYYDVLRTLRAGKQSTTEVELPHKAHRGGPCIPGVARLFVNAEGNLYPCERVSEESKFTIMGHIDSGIDVEKALRILNVEKLSSERCTKCWAYRYCTACIAKCDDIDTLSSPSERGMCDDIRYDIEETFKDYCLLRELHCDFEYGS